MPRRAHRQVPVVIVHGLDGSSPDHWQSWLAGKLVEDGREVRYPQLPDADHPELDVWLATLAETLDGLPELGYDVVCHSLGAALWLHHVHQGGAGPAPERVALVAPPAPDLAVPDCMSFFPVPLDLEAVRAGADGTVLVGSDNDPFCPGGIGQVYGIALKLATTVVPNGGHLNVAAGLGPWPAVLDWCRRDNLAFIA